MFANEGAEKAKAEEELSRRKRKVEDAKLWEGELNVILHLLPFPPGFQCFQAQRRCVPASSRPCPLGPLGPFLPA